MSEELLLVRAEPPRGLDRAAVVRDRLRVGVEPCSMVAAQASIVKVALIVARLAEVMGQHRRELLESVLVQPFQRRPHPSVERPPIPPQDRPVRRLLGEAVVEGVFPFGAPGGLPDEASALQLDQGAAEFRAVASNGAEDRLREGPPDHGCELQGAPCVLVQRIEASRDHGLQGVRDGAMRGSHLDRGGQLLQE